MLEKQNKETANLLFISIGLNKLNFVLLGRVQVNFLPELKSNLSLASLNYGLSYYENKSRE